MIKIEFFFFLVHDHDLTDHLDQSVASMIRRQLQLICFTSAASPWID